MLTSRANLNPERRFRVKGETIRANGSAGALEAVSFSHASVLNVSNVARESQASRKTVEGYIEILEDLLLAFRVPVFRKRARRRTAAHPKLFLFDAGAFRSLRPRGPLDRPEEVAGAALEGLVAQHLRAWIAYAAVDVQLYYWRTRSGVEVDFILYGESVFQAIEVKSSADVRPADVRPLRSFVEDYPECEPILLCRGTEPLAVGGVRCLPVERFLVELRPPHGVRHE